MMWLLNPIGSHGIRLDVGFTHWLNFFQWLRQPKNTVNVCEHLPFLFHVNICERPLFLLSAGDVASVSIQDCVRRGFPSCCWASVHVGLRTPSRAHWPMEGAIKATNKEMCCHTEKISLYWQSRSQCLPMSQYLFICPFWFTLMLNPMPRLEFTQASIDFRYFLK